MKGEKERMGSELEQLVMETPQVAGARGGGGAGGLLGRAAPPPKGGGRALPTLFGTWIKDQLFSTADSSDSLL